MYNYKANYKSLLAQRDFEALLQRERARADRAGSHFSLIVFSVNGLSKDASKLHTFLHELRGRVRGIDEIGWFHGHSIGLLLPLTDLNGVSAVAGDIDNRLFKNRKSIPYSKFSYPSHWYSGGIGKGGGSAGAEDASPSPERPGEQRSAIDEKIESVLAGRYPLWKRSMDVVGALLVLMMCAPLLAALFAFVKTVSPGPALFKQQRVGYKGRLFTFLKVRTMHLNNDVESHRAHLKALIQTDTPMVKLDNLKDPRIIPVGNLLRRACLDELPQLFNVLKGEMSLVGPRPCLPYEAEEYQRWHSHRFDAKPGLTGLWQVSGKNRLTFQQMIRLDIAYCSSKSFFNDLKILFLTGPVIVGFLVEAVTRRFKAARARGTSDGDVDTMAIGSEPGVGMTNVAVVGCGYWGPNLIRNFSALQDCLVKKVCDSSQERLDYIGRLFPGTELTQDFSAVLDDPAIEAVVLATPVRTHFPLGLRSLQAGKHLFIEKPMAASIAECQQLIDLADRESRTLMVGHTFVFNPTVRRIKEVVTSGELGEIMYIGSRRLNLGLFQNDINVAWDLAPHDISIILYILEAFPTSVNCQGKAHIKPGIEDVTNICLNFANGGFALIHSSWIDPKKVRETTIVGSRKMLLYDDTEPLEKIKIYDKCVEVPPHYDTFADFHYSYHYGDMHAPYVKQVEPLRVECQQFLDCLRTGRKPETSGEAGLQVVRILEAATRSLKHGGSLESLS